MPAEWITKKEDQWLIPDHPIICYIEGDGIGPEVWTATKKILDRAVQVAYQGKREIAWEEVLAGEKALAKTGELLPETTLETIRKSKINIKGPLTTPIGGGFRSINVTLRQKLELFSCVRPIRYYPGTSSPIKYPERVDMVIFRENLEDIYTGIEWPSESEESKKLIHFLNTEMKQQIAEDAGVGIKYMTKAGTRRIMRAALQYALENQKDRVTIVHKGNIMKYTEGSFKEWAYELAKEELNDRMILEDQLPASGDVPEGKILINDRIADNMFQQALLKPEQYQILCAPNLNGDYLSDALAAQVGGLGMAPGANIGDEIAIFEATHGSAPKAAGKNRVNPCSLILSGVMMLRFMKWQEAAELVEKSLEETFLAKTMTGDLAREVPGAVTVGTKEFTDLVVKKIN